MTTLAAPRSLPAMPLALLALLAVALLAVAARQAVPVPVAVEVEYTSHAELHAEAQAIRRCLERDGATHVFRTRSWRTPLRFFRTCHLPDGEYGLQIVSWSWRALAWREISAFTVKNGTAAELWEYLQAIATRMY